MRNLPERSLWQALAASLLAHAVLLAGLPERLPAPWPPAGKRIDAQLVVPQAPVHAAQSAAVIEPAVGAVSPPLAEARAPVVDAGHSRRGQRATPPVGGPARGPAARATARRTDPAPNAAPAATSDAHDAPQSETPDSEDLRQYRVDLAVAARRFNAYPPAARSHGWQGTVQVVLEAGARSPGPRARLYRSSGHAVLDAQAVDTLARAARAAPLPPALRARDFRLVVAVRFDLDDER